MEVLDGVSRSRVALEAQHYELLWEAIRSDILGEQRVEGVTPGSTRYGDATVTHIVKYQYVYTLSISVQSEIRLRKHSYIYILTLQSKYIVITKCDPILQEYYITMRYKI